MGFFIAGSSLHEVNGVYGPRLSAEQVSQTLAGLESHLHFGAYQGENGWILAHIRGGESSESEWVFLDATWRDRFVHDGNTLIPGAGPRWRHVSRESRPGAPEADATGGPTAAEPPDGAAAGGGVWHGGAQVRSYSEADRESELPWQVIGVRDPHMLENLRRQGRAHSEQAAAWVQTRARALA